MKITTAIYRLVIDIFDIFTYMQFTTSILFRTFSNNILLSVKDTFELKCVHYVIVKLTTVKYI